ncbi:MAG: peptide chain release factor N(5)-glutamine methyltransferase [Alphaproteobacteria bacterium]|nr:peptide chain release factor N(5)-glutamine methyltransferase [Alphaproteobacteria bacterium]
MNINQILHKYKTCCDLRSLRILIAEIMRVPLSQVLLSTSNEISVDKSDVLEALIERYINGEPISKILNRKEFWKDVFFVNEHVLDPRPESEIIIETSLKFFGKECHFNFLDIGTGSGCLLLSLAKEFRFAFGVGIDVSKEAIDVAEINQKKLALENISLLNIGWNDFQSDIKFDLIVSNPPYIKSSDILMLDDSVKKYDPLLALDGGSSGLDAYVALASRIRTLLSSNGLVLLEVGQGQDETVSEIFNQSGYEILNTIQDLQSIPRVVVLKTCGNSLVKR